MIVISDTSVISNLIQIGQIDLLRKLYGLILITSAVYYEVTKLELQKRIVDAAEWIVIRDPNDEKLVHTLLQELDLGEAESIVLALEQEAEHLLIIDEYKGREVAVRYGLKITGLLGVLILAKKRGLIEEVATQIRMLQNVGFHLSSALIGRVLKQLGEK